MDLGRQKNGSSEEIANAKLSLGLFDIWVLGITVVVGGQYFSWNAGLQAGFGSYLISTVFMGIAYIVLCICNAEVASALPFAGGAYGMARVSLGLYAGFIVGCLEACEYIAYVASSCIVLSTLVCDTTGSSLTLMPLYSLIFFLITVWIQVSGGLLFWRINAVLGVGSLGILLMYNFGSLYWANIVNVSSPATTGSHEYTYFVGGMRSFVTVTPLAAWWFVGVESLNLCNAFVANVSTVSELELFALLCFALLSTDLKLSATIFYSTSC
jgi:ethanolamine permease